MMKVKNKGSIDIDGYKIKCYVLIDNTRIISGNLFDDFKENEVQFNPRIKGYTIESIIKLFGVKNKALEILLKKALIVLVDSITKNKTEDLMSFDDAMSIIIQAKPPKK